MAAPPSTWDATVKLANAIEWVSTIDLDCVLRSDPWAAVVPGKHACFSSDTGDFRLFPYEELPLSRSMRLQDPPIVKRLLMAGVDPNTPDWNNWLPISLAHGACVGLLLAHGADPNIRTTNLRGDPIAHVLDRYFWPDKYVDTEEDMMKIAVCVDMADLRQRIIDNLDEERRAAHKAAVYIELNKERNRALMVVYHHRLWLDSTRLILHASDAGCYGPELDLPTDLAQFVSETYLPCCKDDLFPPAQQ